MEKKIIEFGKKTNILMEFVEYLRGMADIMECAFLTVQDEAPSFVAKAGLDFSRFSINPDDLGDFWEGNGEHPLVYTYKEPGVDYYLFVFIELEEDKFFIGLYRSFSDREENIDPDTGEWVVTASVPVLPEKLQKILDKQSPESEILEEYLSETNDFSEAHYQSFRQVHRSLFSLYNQVYKYMEPFCLVQGFGNVVMYLVPRDLFRHGFMVGQQEKYFVLYQMAGMEYCMGLEYKREVGRTTDIAQIKHCLYQMANRYADTDTYTLPLSLSASTESTNPNQLGRRIFFNRTVNQKLDEKEKKNLTAGKQAMRKLADLFAEIDE